MFKCPSCNGELRENARICIKCGYKVTEEDRTESLDLNSRNNPKLNTKIQIKEISADKVDFSSEQDVRIHLNNSKAEKSN